MCWYKNHIQWLYAESIALSKSLHYDEKYQEIGRTFVSHGEVLVLKEKAYRHPVLVVFPDATPFVPPIVFLLKELLPYEDVVRLSTLAPAEIAKVLLEKIAFHSKRHQNLDGSVCFVEMGDLHDEHAESYPIKDILKRLRAWLAGETPLDSPEAELFHHFNSRATDKKLLLPNDFYSREDITKGDFAFIKFPSIFNASGHIWLGAAIIGESPAGITLAPKAAKNGFSTLSTFSKEKPLEVIVRAQ